MGSSLALLAFIIGIAGLFYLDRDRSVRTSKALWIPVIWFWIVGSRTVAEWLQVGPAGQNVRQQQMDGSPLDAAVFLSLLLAGAVVLLRRKRQTLGIIKASAPLVIFYAYCLLTVLWAPFPGVMLKRWIKDVGDLIIALVVVTDARPDIALRRVFSRVGFILLPMSIFLIKYSDLGHGIDEYGNRSDTGVTTNKNMLGLTVWVFSIGAVWNICEIVRNRTAPHRGRRLASQAVLLSSGLLCLALAHSATSISCFVVGSFLIVLTRLRAIGRRPRAVHAMVFTLVVLGGLAKLLGGEDAVFHALGRKSNLTGRTDIWKAVIPLAPRPITGAGFQSFWISLDPVKLREALPGWGAQFINSAHNGYIEAYLDLGIIGLGLTIFLLIAGYQRAVAAFRLDPGFGSLMLAYVVTAAMYSITEAGFRMLTPSWIFLLLAFVGAAGISKGWIRTTAVERLRQGKQGRPLSVMRDRPSPRAGIDYAGPAAARPHHGWH